MQQYINIGTIIVIAILVVVVALRLYYKHISDEIEEFTDAKDINAVKEVNDMDGYQVIDIPKLLASQYKDSLIKKVDATALAEELSPLYTKLVRLQKRLDQMHLDSNDRSLSELLCR